MRMKKKSVLEKYTLKDQIEKQMLKSYIKEAASLRNKKVRDLSEKEIEARKEEFNQYYNGQSEKEKRKKRKNFLRKNKKLKAKYMEAVGKRIAICTGGVLAVGTLIAGAWKLAPNTQTIETNKQEEMASDLIVENRKNQETLIAEKEEREACMEGLPEFFEGLNWENNKEQRNNEIRHKTEEVLSLIYNQKCMEDEAGKITYTEETGTIIKNLDAMKQVVNYQLKNEKVPIDEDRQKEEQMTYYVFSVNGREVAACTKQGERIYGDIYLSFENASELISRTKSLQDAYISRYRGVGESERFVKEKEEKYAAAIERVMGMEIGKEEQEQLANSRE
ncbi:MAG: hypothetical protein ACLTEH_00505 [Clostridia bacterium]